MLWKRYKNSHQENSSIVNNAMHFLNQFIKISTLVVQSGGLRECIWFSDGSQDLRRFRITAWSEAAGRPWMGISNAEH